MLKAFWSFVDFLGTSFWMFSKEIWQISNHVLQISGRQMLSEHKLKYYTEEFLYNSIIINYFVGFRRNRLLGILLINIPY